MTSIEKFEKETGLEYFEYLEETGYLVPIEYVKWLEKQCTLHDVLNSTLEIKTKAHESVCAWFEIAHDKYTYKHNVGEMNENKIELNAQIKMLRHLLSTQ